MRNKNNMVNIEKKLASHTIPNSICILLELINILLSIY